MRIYFERGWWCAAITGTPNWLSALHHATPSALHPKRQGNQLTVRNRSQETLRRRLQRAAEETLAAQKRAAAAATEMRRRTGTGEGGTTTTTGQGKLI